jgi:hypothetical protein
MSLVRKTVHYVTENELLNVPPVPVVQTVYEPAAEGRPVVALERIAESLERIVQWQIRFIPWGQEIDGRGGERRLIPAPAPSRQEPWHNDDGGNGDRQLQLTAAALPLNNGTGNIETRLNEIFDLLNTTALT